MVDKMNQVGNLRLQNPLMQKISTIIAYYLAVSSILPQFRVFSGYNLSIFIAMFAWLISVGLVHPIFFIRFRIHTFFILLFIIYTFIIPYLFGNGTIGNRYLTNSLMLIFYLIYRYNNTYGFNNSSKSLIKWSLPFIIYTSIATLIGLVHNPYLARSIKSSGEYTISLRAQGIGGYELIYFLVFLSIIIFFAIINRRTLNLKLYSVVMIIIVLFIFLLTIIYSNYFTALIMTVISFGVIIITKYKSLFIKIFTIFFGIILLIFSKDIFIFLTNWLINFLGNGATANKLLRLQADVMGYGGSDSILLERGSTIKSSWSAFLENPIGGIVVNPIESRGGFFTGFGQHSYFMDTFSLYGLFIGLINVYIVLHPFFIRMKKKSIILFGLNLSMLLSTLILLSMNNVTPSIGFAIFLIYPVFQDWIVERIR